MITLNCQLYYICNHLQDTSVHVLLGYFQRGMHTYMSLWKHTHTHTRQVLLLWRLILRFQKASKAKKCVTESHSL